MNQPEIDYTAMKNRKDQVVKHLKEVSALSKGTWNPSMKEQDLKTQIPLPYNLPMVPGKHHRENIIIAIGSTYGSRIYSREQAYCRKSLLFDMEELPKSLLVLVEATSDANLPAAAGLGVQLL